MSYTPPPKREVQKAVLEMLSSRVFAPDETQNVTRLIRNKPDAGQFKGQVDDISPSIAALLDDGSGDFYVRVAKFPQTESGKAKAKARAAEIRREGEGELFVRVRAVRFKSTGEKVWAVYAKGIGTGRLAPVQYGRGSVGQQTDAFREWTAYRQVAKETQACPKCNAPMTVACVSRLDLYPENATQADVDRVLITTRRRYRTNVHKERVDAYFKVLNAQPSLPPARKYTAGEAVRFLERDASAATLEKFEDSDAFNENAGTRLRWFEENMSDAERVRFEEWKQGRR